MSWLYQGAGELLPLHHPRRLICSPLFNLPLSLFLEMSKISINRRKRMEVVKASKLRAPTSNSNPWALHQLPGTCPPGMLPPATQGLQPSTSYKGLNLESWGPRFSKASPRKMLLPTHSCYHPSRVWALNPALGGCWKPSCQEVRLLFTDLPFSCPKVGFETKKRPEKRQRGVQMCSGTMVKCRELQCFIGVMLHIWML